MKRIPVLFLALLALFGGCSKEKSATTPTVYIDTGMKDFMFGKNSWWVYSNDSLNQSDSLFVSKIDTGFYMNPPPVQGDPGVRREFYKMSVDASNHQESHVDFIDSDRWRRNPTTEWYICGRYLYSVKPIYGKEHLDSLVVNGIVFRNVTKTFVPAVNYVAECGNSGFLYNTEFYLVPKIGIVRKVVHQDQHSIAWNLLKWHITQ